MSKQTSGSGSAAVVEQASISPMRAAAREKSLTESFESVERRTDELAALLRTIDRAANPGAGDDFKALLADLRQTVDFAAQAGEWLVDAVSDLGTDLKNAGHCRPESANAPE